MLEELSASSAESAQQQDLERKHISEMREATKKNAEENATTAEDLQSQLVSFHAQVMREKGMLDTERTRLQQWALELPVPMHLQPPGQPSKQPPPPPPPSGPRSSEDDVCTLMITKIPAWLDEGTVANWLHGTPGLVRMVFSSGFNTKTRSSRSWALFDTRSSAESALHSLQDKQCFDGWSPCYFDVEIARKNLKPWAITHVADTLPRGSSSSGAAPTGTKLFLGKLMEEDTAVRINSMVQMCTSLASKVDHIPYNPSTGQYGSAWATYDSIDAAVASMTELQELVKPMAWNTTRTWSLTIDWASG